MAVVAQLRTLPTGIRQAKTNKVRRGRRLRMMNIEQGMVNGEVSTVDEFCTPLPALLLASSFLDQYPIFPSASSLRRTTQLYLLQVQGVAAPRRIGLQPGRLLTTRTEISRVAQPRCSSVFTNEF